MKKQINQSIKALLLCFFLVAPPLFLSAQPSLDSLEQLLVDKNLTYVEKIKIYDDLSWFYTNINVQRSIYFGKEGLELAQENQDPKMEAILLKNIAVAYYMGGVHDTAISFLEKSLPIVKELGEYRLESSVYNTYANIYLVNSQYDLALENYFAALNLLEKQNDIQKTTLLYSNIAGVYIRMSNIDQALKYYDKAEKLAIQTDDQEGLAAIYISLSDIYVKQDKPKEIPIDYAQKAYEIYKKTSNKQAENYAMQTLAKVYYNYDDYATAEPLAKQAVLGARELGFNHLMASALIILSNVHFHQGQYAPAAQYAMEALKSDSTDSNITSNAYANLARSSAYLGNPENTDKYFDHYRDALNDYANTNFQTSISEMEVKYATEKNQLKIHSLEKQRQLYIWLGIAIAFILLFLLALILIRYRLAISRRKLAEKEAQRLEQEKQLVAVKATLDGEAAERTRLAKDLHDGLGSMLSLVKFNLPQVKGDALLETVDVSRFQKALGMLDDSIHELRRVAHHMMPESLLRYGLKASLSDFCEAIPIVDFHYFGDETRLSEKLEIMIYRCIHELVNNALKHSEATQINVQLVQEEDRVSFTVHDNGVGFQQDKVSEGMGLKNVRQRVTAFQGNLNIYSSDQGTEIHVELDLTQGEKVD